VPVAGHHDPARREQHRRSDTPEVAQDVLPWSERRRRGPDRVLVA
jgi:hypothetical protein